ncbi:MAG TPA: PhnD/SsuA/transferrin family substrate-binding protein [Pirellulaceae bacterium]|nr:PhnD/SsuA/transferrin family substrate-binding protein [Pirellulaceae bacterium]HMO93325.1 PhnD/SsuA/transferrin family substrate-binding protein [Pirellulaceae bacterium]HMP69136.1 PhnD/SsuA/transferrin family substrate-binding protein [Pirellulaceae bacterium]
MLTRGQMNRKSRWLLALAAWSLGMANLATAFGDDHFVSAADEPLVVVVMDPLSDKLACDCVEGYAQRKYEVLGQHLQRTMGRKVEVYWGESIEAALKDENAKRVTPLSADLVIGKHSVIVSESKHRSLGLQPVAQLTGKDGSTVQYGFVVVRGTDPAILVEDLQGYRIIFGPANCDEKNAAPRQLLVDAEIHLPAELETADACSVAAKKLLECPKDEKVAAIISSYAAPLLEGCGTINKGDLRVVGKSDPVPFITAFIPEQVDGASRSQLIETLLAVGNDAKLVQALETRDGFVPFTSEPTTTEVGRAKSSGTQTSAEKKTK